MVLRLKPEDEVESFRGRLSGVSRIEILFPSFGDGRGYSTARLLRTRYGYRGELRAVGPLTRDLVPFLVQVGFDAYELRESQK